MPKLFGTDGVRGVAGVDLTPELAWKLGRAAGSALCAHTALLARDTRLSGPELEEACAAGLARAGVDVRLAGVLPSPAVSHLTRSQNYDLGVVVSASHNPPSDNGIKLYDRHGLKLSPQEEEVVESLLDTPRTGGAQGSVAPFPEAEEAYRAFLEGTVPGLSLSGWRIALDCAYGATAGVAPPLFAELGASLVLLGGDPDGARINATGAVALTPLQQAVRVADLDLGIAFDGDGDRVMFADSQGEIVEGDRLIAAVAPLLWGWREITSPSVVFTVLANTGAECHLRDRGFEVLRVAVGDRNVSWAMRQHGVEIGGEPSGHIVFGRHAPTGDGILTALLVLQMIQRAETSLGTLVAPVPNYPQVREDIPVREREAALAAPGVRQATAAAERMLAGWGRLVVRPSGTQPVIRIFAEGPDENALRRAVDAVARALDRFRG